MQALVLAAGKGTRMRSDRPKVLHEILGRPILEYVLTELAALGIRRPGIVVGSGGNQVSSFLRTIVRRHPEGRRPKGSLRSFGPSGLRMTCQVVRQHRQRGTGHAVMAARRALGAGDGDLLIWPGDMPLLKAATIRLFLRHHRQARSDASVLSALMVDPDGYGRILRAGGRFYAIREDAEAGASERRIQEVNTGVYLFKRRALFEALREIRPDNSKREFYLTDTLEALSRRGRRIEAFPLASDDEAQGINSREDLGRVILKMGRREIQHHQESGVTFVAPEQTFVAPRVRIGRDTVIYPWCFIESGVAIGRGCQIGPFARIRSGTRIEDGAVIGSFVEVTRSHIGKKVLAKHLAYLGDVDIGAGTNIGAGTVVANYDGRRKHKTRIGKNVMVGSDTVLVAPVAVGDGAKTGAGCVITAGSRVPKGAVVAGVPARPLRKKRYSGGRKS